MLSSGTQEPIQTSSFWGRWLGRFFLCICRKSFCSLQFSRLAIFRKILCFYISGLQLINVSPKTLKKIRGSYFTYLHGILVGEKGLSTNSEKRLRLIYNYVLVMQFGTWLIFPSYFSDDIYIHCEYSVQTMTQPFSDCLIQPWTWGLDLSNCTWKVNEK